MNLRDAILDYIEEYYGDIFINNDIEDKIIELDELIETSAPDEHNNKEEDDLEYYPDMDEFADEDE
jgi:hypothetical protein